MPSAVLVVATDALAAALLGAAVELAGYAPVFPREGETPREALRRSKPSVVLVDCDSEEACGESFFGPAMMMGAGVAVFTSTRSRGALGPVAKKYGVRSFQLPIDFGDLSALLDACAGKPST